MKGLIAASIMALSTYVAADRVNLQNPLSQTTARIYADIHRNTDHHPHTVNETEATVPYISDAYLVPCAEGHATCPEWAGILVYEPNKDRSYLVETSGDKGKIEKINISVVKGILPKNIFDNTEFPSFLENLACAHEYGEYRNPAMVAASNRSGIKEGRILGYMDITATDSSSPIKYCTTLDGKDKSNLMKDSLFIFKGN